MDKPADTDATTTRRRAFGERVRALRKAAGLTQEAVAGAAGMDRAFLVEIEAGRRNPSLDSIHRIADALGVPVTDLFA